MGVSFTLLLIYPYGNRSQDELNRKLGSLQQWSKLGSKKNKPSWELGPAGSRRVGWGPSSD